VRSGRGGGGPRGLSVGAADGLTVGLHAVDRVIDIVLECVLDQDLVSDIVSLLDAVIVILPQALSEGDDEIVLEPLGERVLDML